MTSSMADDNPLTASMMSSYTVDELVSGKSNLEITSVWSFDEVSPASYLHSHKRNIYL